MQPTLCSRCHKNVAVIFVTRIEGGETKNEGLCLKCAKELGIKPVEDMMQKMGINDEDLEGLTNEMMSAFGGDTCVKFYVTDNACGADMRTQVTEGLNAWPLWTKKANMALFLSPLPT